MTTPVDAPQERRARLLDLDVEPAELDTLEAYTTSHFGSLPGTGPVELPLPSEAHVEVWREYAERVASEGSLACLADTFPQLRFPIAEGMSADPEYQNATRRGAEAIGGAHLRLELAHAERIRLTISDTAAGAVPVVTVPHRSDFVTLVRAFVNRNEPAVVPPTQGACIVSGYNNWDRVARHRSAFFASGGAAAQWAVEFRTLASRKELYQDRFILLSDGPYSALSADRLGMSDESWRTASLTLRREHECAHYLTHRLFGSMGENLHDELIGDFAGICAIHPRFRADWFLLFLGLEDYPAYRGGGRLENYVRAGTFSERSLAALRTLLFRAATNVERFLASSQLDTRDIGHRATIIVALASLDLDILAAREASKALGRAVQEAQDRIRWAPELGS